VRLSPAGWEDVQLITGRSDRGKFPERIREVYTGERGRLLFLKDLTLENPSLTRFLTPVLSIMGGLGLATWAIYQDYMRRQRRNAGRLRTWEKGKPLPGTGEEGCETPRRSNTLRTGLILLGIGAGLHLFLRNLAPRLAGVGYLIALIGIGCLVSHVAQRRDAPSPQRDGEELG